MKCEQNTWILEVVRTEMEIRQSKTLLRGT